MRLYCDVTQGPSHSVVSVKISQNAKCARKKNVAPDKTVGRPGKTVGRPGNKFQKINCSQKVSRLFCSSFCYYFLLSLYMFYISMQS